MSIDYLNNNLFFYLKNFSFVGTKRYFNNGL